MLTDEQIEEFYQLSFNGMPDRARKAPPAGALVFEFARAIESAVHQSQALRDGGAAASAERFEVWFDSYVASGVGTPAPSAMYKIAKAAWAAAQQEEGAKP